MDPNVARLSLADRERLLHHGAIVSKWDIFRGRIKYLLPTGEVFALETHEDGRPVLGTVENRMISEALLRRIYKARPRVFDACLA